MPIKGRRWWFVVVLAVVFVAVMMNFFRIGGDYSYRETSYSELIDAIQAGNVRDVTLSDCVAMGQFDDGMNFQAQTPCNDQHLIDTLVNHGVQVRFERSESSPLMNWLLYWTPSLLMIGLYVYYLRAMLRALNDISAKLAALRTEISQSQTGKLS